MVCSFLIASAPPCAATACFTRSAADCADAGLVNGLASDAPTTSATVDTTIRNMKFLPVGKRRWFAAPVYAGPLRLPTPGRSGYSAVKPEYSRSGVRHAARAPHAAT